MNVEKRIAAPPELVWTILVDTDLWPRWGPSVRRVDCPQRLIATGVRGRIQTAPGLWLPFEITVFEPGRYWHWRVASIPATGHRLQDLGEQGCRVSFEIPFGAFPYAAVCRLALSRIERLAEDLLSASPAARWS